MIPLGQRWHLARSSSPERERRLCWFARENDEPPEAQNADEGMEGGVLRAESQEIDAIIAETRRGMVEHDALKKLLRLIPRGRMEDEEARAFIARHGHEIPVALPEYREGELNAEDLNAMEVRVIMSKLRAQLPDVLRDRTHDMPHPDIYFNAGDGSEDYEAAYLKARLKAKLKQNCPDFARMDQDQVRALAEQHGVASQELPTAFQRRDSIYFNVREADYRDRTYRERSIAHELTHFVVRNRPPQLLKSIHKAMKEDSDAYARVSEAWKSLMDHEEFGRNQSFSVERKLHEVLAVYMASLRHSYDADDKSTHATIARIVGDMRTKSKKLDELLSVIDGDIMRDESRVRERFEVAIEEDDSANAIARELESSEVFTNTEQDTEERQRREQEERAAQERARVQEEEARKFNPVAILAEIDQTSQKITSQLDQLPKLLKRAGDRPEDNKTADVLREVLAAGGMRLVQLKRLVEEARNDATLSPEERLEKMRMFYQARKNIDDTIEDVVVKTMTEFDTAVSEWERKKDLEKYKEKGPLRAFMSGIEFRTVDDIVKVVKLHWEAIVNAYKSQQNVRVNKTAKDIAKIYDYVPYAKSVQQILYKQARATNDEETSKFADYIKSEGFTYDELLGDKNSILYQNRGNVNRAKAIIEYAADHGWLYDMDKTNGHNVYGVDFESEFGTHSFLELINRNEAGKEKEVKRGEERVRYHPEIKLIIEDIRDELKKKNIYAVRGMLQILQNKAKLGESNTWGLTTLMRALQKDKSLLDIMETNLLDNIGNIGIAQSAWSLTQFKTQRKQILAWKQRKGEDMTRDAGFKMARTIKHIEELIPERKRSVERVESGELDHDIAKVLAGQTLRYPDEPGLSISIFNNDAVFNDYRKYFSDTTQSTDTKPDQTDDDFFNPDNIGSDVLLLGDTQTLKILKRESQGAFTHRTKATNFVAQIIDRYDELASMPAAQANFKREMAKKLNYWMQTDVVTNASASRQIAAENDKKERNILIHLYDRGLIDVAYFDRLRSEYQRANNIAPPPYVPPRANNAA